jgi:hypothetical protein
MHISEQPYVASDQSVASAGLAETQFGGQRNVVLKSSPESDQATSQPDALNQLITQVTGQPSTSYMMAGRYDAGRQSSAQERTTEYVSVPSDATAIGGAVSNDPAFAPPVAVGPPEPNGSNYGFQMGREARSVAQENALPQVLNSTGQGIYSSLSLRGNTSQVNVNKGLGIAGSVLGGAAGLAGASGNEALSRGLSVASSTIDVGQAIANKDVSGAALAGIGGVGTAIGGKTGRAISEAVSVGSTVKSVSSAISRGGAIGVGSAIAGVAGLAANYLKGTVGKIVGGISSAAGIAVQAASAVASGAASIAQGIAGGLVGGIGAAFSLIGGKVGQIIGKVASIAAPLLMGNPIGAAIGAIAIIAGMLFRPKGRYESNQKADLLGRVADANGQVVTDRLHRGKKNTLEIFINDGTGKETKTQTIEMGGYFQKKRQAGQDKLVDLQGDGRADILWQGDKKHANHITTFINLGDGKFGDPQAAAKAAEKMARMNEYISTHPKPIYTAEEIKPLSQSAQDLQAMQFGSNPSARARTVNEGYGTRVNGELNDMDIIRKANEWLNGLEAAANGAEGKKGNSYVSVVQASGISNVSSAAPAVRDQTQHQGVDNKYKHAVSSMGNGLRDRNGNISQGSYGMGSRGGYHDSSFTPFQGANSDGAAKSKLDNINERLNRVIDDSVGTMRKQLEMQANPEGRVASEQDLNISVKKYAAEQMKFADLNADGVTDMVMTGKYVQGGVWAFLGRGDGTFETNPIEITKEVEAQKASIAASESARSSSLAAA